MIRFNIYRAFIQGAEFFIQGCRLIFQPGLKRYIVIPVICNAILLVLIFWSLASFLFGSLNPFFASYSKWVMMIFGWLFWIFYSLVSLLISSFVFTMLTNIIAAPFYGLLAAASAKILSNGQNTIANTNGNTNANANANAKYQNTNINTNAEHTNTGNTNNTNWLKTAFWIAPRTLAREGKKLLYFFPWILLCLSLWIFPFIWFLIPFVWGIVLAWILAIQYMDYQPDNQEISFKEVMILLKQHPYQTLGFGTIVSVAMMIPGANLFVPPAAVAGGTALWLFLQSQKTT